MVWVAPLAHAEVASRLIVDPVGTDGLVHGNLVTGLQPGDRVTLLVEVENVDWDSVQSLFTVAGFDPAVVAFDTGTTDEEILDEGGFTGASLSRLIQPQLRFGGPDEAIALAHASTGFPSEEGTPVYVGILTFDVVGRDVATTIRHEISVYDECIINGNSNNSNTTPDLDLGSPVVLAVPEPGFGSLAGVGLVALSTLGRVRRRRPGRRG